MTYNVHSCIGTDGRLSVQRIARVIARHEPDIVALQELDEARERSSGENQAQLIAHLLEMDYHFHPVIHAEGERYGDAVLTHLPMRLVKSAALPGLAARPAAEPRGVLWVAVTFNGMEIQVLNTHFGLSWQERLRQIRALTGKDWLANPLCREPVILCGDFNALPGSTVCRHLRKYLDDAQIKMQRHQPRGTYYSRLPGARIDHIYIDPATAVTGIHIPGSRLELSASDHLPLIADLEFSPLG